VFVFQSFTLLSSLPLAKIVESGLQATELTQSECPLTGHVGLASSKSPSSSKVQVQFGLSSLQNC